MHSLSVTTRILTQRMAKTLTHSNMTLHDAIALNRDAVRWVQTGFEDTAIQLYTTRWATLDFGIPDGLDDSVPDQVARLLAESSLLPSTVNDFDSEGLVESDSKVVENGPLEELKRRPEGRAIQVTSMRSIVTVLPVVIATCGPAYTMTSVPTSDDMSPHPWKVPGVTRIDYDDDRTKHTWGNIFTMYNRVFDVHVLHDAASTTLGWLRCFSCLPIVISYNAGVAHHIQAVRWGSARSFILALANYDVAYQLIQGQLACHHYDRTMDLLVMAMYNNMGHCHEQLGDSARSMVCFDHMLVVIATSDRTHDLTVGEYYFFCERVSLALVKLDQPASAA